MGIRVGHQPEPNPGTIPASSSAGPTTDRSRPRRYAAQDPRSSRRWRRSPTSNRARRTRGSRYGQEREIRARTRLQGNLQQMPGIEPQDRSSVGVQVADPGQAVDHSIRHLEIRGVDQVVNFPGLVELLVDGRDLDRQHEPDRGTLAPARGGQPFLDGSFQIGAQAKQSRLRGHELLFSSARQAGWVKSPVATMPMPFLRAQMARCSRSQFLLVAREYLE